MTNTTDDRPFIRMLFESGLEEEALKQISVYLIDKRARLNVSARPSNKDEEIAFEHEKKLLAQEETILYTLVSYLQKTGHIKSRK